MILEIALLSKLLGANFAVEPLVLVNRFEVVGQPLTSAECLGAEMAGQSHVLVDGLQVLVCR